MSKRWDGVKVMVGDEVNQHLIIAFFTAYIHTFNMTCISIQLSRVDYLS